MSDRPIPYSIEAELAIIGCLMTTPDVIDQMDGLGSDQFYEYRNRLVFETIFDCLEDSQAVDVVTVYERLERADKAAEVGGMPFLHSAVQMASSPANIAHYARIVRERSLERNLLAASAEIDAIVHSTTTIREKLDQAQQCIMAVAESDAKQSIAIADLVQNFKDTLQRRRGGQLIGLPTGLADLDKRLAGLKPGNLIIIAGRPSMGKSALGVQFAEHAAQQGQPALVLSMEMSAVELMDRIVSGVTRISLEKIISGEAASFPTLNRAMENIAKWPLYIDDSPGLTLMEVRTKARAIKRKYGLALLVVDYLQLMSGEGDNRNAVVETISRGLKALAKELQIPVIALSQLNRAVEQRADRRPLLSDLRDSGAIEQDADVVMFVHREEVYRRNDPEWTGCAEVLIRKNRQGPIADVRLTYIGEFVHFGNFAGEWPATKARNLKAVRNFGDD